MKRRYSLFCAKERGFTIIELSVVIVVIGVLASIVIVSGGSYLKRSSESNAKTSLVTARAALNQEYDKNGEYPEDIPSSVSIPDGFNYETNGSDFCIGGNISGESWYISKDKSEPRQGVCPGLSEPTDPGGGLAISLEINPIEVQPPGNLEETDGVFASAVTITGGAPPYTYSLESNDSSTAAVEAIPNQYYGVTNDAATSGEIFMVVMPNAIFELGEEPTTPEDAPFFVDKLLIAATDESGQGPFVAICQDWIINAITANLKLVVTDSESNQAEVPFTLGCAS